jgi:hypothetical protein
LSAFNEVSLSDYGNLVDTWSGFIKKIFKGLPPLDLLGILLSRGGAFIKKIEYGGYIIE